MDTINYTEYSLEELYQAKRDIDQQSYPERYQAICNEISERHAASPESLVETNLSDDTIVQLNPWLVRILGVLTIGGSFSGIATLATHLTAMSSLLVIILMAFILLMYLVGLYVGVRLFEQTSVQVLKENLYFWLLQIPIFISPIFGYQFNNGVMLNLWLSSSDGFNFAAAIGSTFNFSLMQWHQPWALGVNVVAIAIAFLFQHCLSVAHK